MPGTQLNWTYSRVGEVRNQIPERAVATGDVRTTVAGGAERLQVALQDKVKAAGRLVPDTETTVGMQIGRPAYVANEASRVLAKRAQEIYAEPDGRELMLVPGTGGATDAGSPAAPARRSCSRASASPAGAITRATSTSSSTRSCRAST